MQQPAILTISNLVEEIQRSDGVPYGILTSTGPVRPRISHKAIHRDYHHTCAWEAQLPWVRNGKESEQRMGYGMTGGIHLSGNSGFRHFPFGTIPNNCLDLDSPASDFAGIAYENDIPPTPRCPQLDGSQAPRTNEQGGKGTSRFRCHPLRVEGHPRTVGRSGSKVFIHQMSD